MDALPYVVDCLSNLLEAESDRPKEVLMSNPEKKSALAGAPDFPRSIEEMELLLKTVSDEQQKERERTSPEFPPRS
jgi:hypothetical protein